MTDEMALTNAFNLERCEGIFVEHVGATSAAMLKRAIERRSLKKTDTVAYCLTGLAFKDMDLLIYECENTPIEVDASRPNQSEYLKRQFKEGFIDG